MDPPHTSTGRFILIASIPIAPEKLDAAKAYAAKVRDVAVTKAEPGVLSYRISFDPVEKNSLFFFEEYESKEAFTSHLARPELHAFAAALEEEGLAIGTWTVNFYEEF